MGARTGRGLPLSNSGLLSSIAPPGNGHQVSYKPPYSARAGVPIDLSSADGEERAAEAVDRHNEAKTRRLVFRVTYFSSAPALALSPFWSTTPRIRGAAGSGVILTAFSLELLFR